MRKSWFYSLRIIASVSLHKPFNNHDDVGDVVLRNIRNRNFEFKMEWPGWSLSTKGLEFNEHRQQEIAILFLVAKDHARLLARLLSKGSKGFCHVFTSTVIATGAGSKVFCVEYVKFRI